jgi:copper homeostasis protein
MKPNPIQLEICAVSPTSALAALEGGADRIELCAALETGGISPSFAAIEMCTRSLDIPVFVLVRPRPGDFCYNETELQLMIRDISICRELGVSGIVSGSLHPDGNIHLPQLQALLRASEGMDFTFHRAFDRCRDPFLAASQLAAFGVQRILSSGQQPTALQGAALLSKLIEKMEGKISFMPGGGITADNIGEIYRITGATEVHFSAKKVQKSPFSHQNDMSGNDDYSESDPSLIRQMVGLLRSF